MHCLSKKRAKFIVSCVCLLIIFINMNRIISCFFENNVKIHKVNFEDYVSCGQAYAYLNEYEYDKENLQEILRCSGWAFAETTENNDNKEIYLIFKGNKASYITEKCSLLNSSVQTTTKEWKSILGDHHNFNIAVSTLSLPSDTYEIYAYVEENDKSKGIVDTGRSFKKEGVNLYSYSVGDIVESINPSDINNIFSCGWNDGPFSKNGCIELSGWQAIENRNSEASKYYLVFVGDNKQNVTIQIPNIYLTALEESLGSYDYIASGFRGSLDKKNLPDETGVVYVVAKNNGDYYKTAEYEYDINQSSE